MDVLHLGETRPPSGGQLSSVWRKPANQHVGIHVASSWMVDVKFAPLFVSVCAVSGHREGRRVGLVVSRKACPHCARRLSFRKRFYGHWFSDSRLFGDYRCGKLIQWMDSLVIQGSSNHLLLPHRGVIGRHCILRCRLANNFGTPDVSGQKTSFTRLRCSVLKARHAAWVVSV